MSKCSNCNDRLIIFRETCSRSNICPILNCEGRCINYVKNELAELYWKQRRALRDRVLLGIKDSNCEEKCNGKHKRKST